MYGLYYVHSLSHKAALALLEEQTRDWLARPARMETMSFGRWRQAQALCLQYYRRKLRTPKKPESLRQMKTAFPMTEMRLKLLCLPETFKSPVVLGIGWGLPSDTLGEILGCPPWLVERRLAKARKRLARAPEGSAEAQPEQEGENPRPRGPEERPCPERAGEGAVKAQAPKGQVSRGQVPGDGAEAVDEEIRGAVWGIRPPEGSLPRAFDRLLLEREERGFAGKQRLIRWKRQLDRMIPWIALLILLFLLGAFWYAGQGR